MLFDLIHIWMVCTGISSTFGLSYWSVFSGHSLRYLPISTESVTIRSATDLEPDPAQISGEIHGFDTDMLSFKSSCFILLLLEFCPKCAAYYGNRAATYMMISKYD